MFTMKIYNKFKKIICCTLLLIVLSIACSGCHFYVTTEESISSKSSSKSSSYKGSSSSTGNFALKYKDQEMDFDEYLCIVASMIISLKEQTKNISSTNTVSSSEDEYKIKMMSTQLAKICLIVRQKSNQLSADLEEKTKKLVESSCSDTQIAEESQALGFNRYALRKCAEDVARIAILEKQNFDPGKLMSENQVTVNYEITNKVNIDQLVENIEKYIKDGGKFIKLDEKILQQKTI